MTPEQQRIAIAEACGWTGIHEEVHPTITYMWGYDSKFKHPKARRMVPNYPNDLNAMHEAEKVLINFTNVLNYHCDLLEVVVRTRRLDAGRKWPFSLCINATAAQRAEAFLRTIGKWKETKGHLKLDPPSAGDVLDSNAY